MPDDTDTVAAIRDDLDNSLPVYIEDLGGNLHKVDIITTSNRLGGRTCVVLYMDDRVSD